MDRMLSCGVEKEGGRDHATVMQAMMSGEDTCERGRDDRRCIQALRSLPACLRRSCDDLRVDARLG